MTINDVITFYLGTVAGMYATMLFVTIYNHIGKTSFPFNPITVAVILLFYPITMPAALYRYYKVLKNARNSSN